ncbi:MAG TPA: VOC family protein [Terriglobales bacterium]|jgi:catechol 2,3-dioxygenase-like lactoylglutathione lyase family enzyme|nr:VOC family protein [Terriglobales bacterium]
MLGSNKIVAFVPTLDSVRARAFYEGILGLKFIFEDAFALVLDANGIRVRVAKAPEFKPAPFTILGWEVSDIESKVSDLVKQGVRFEMIGIPGQAENGIWSAPSGAKVAWFKDPDGNILSLSQHP